MTLDEGLDPTTLAKAIGERLRAFREEHGLSQGDVAERTNIARETINRYEAGTSVPTLTNAGVLARFMDVMVDWLMFGDGGTDATLRDRLLFNRFLATQELDAADRRSAMDLLDAFIANAAKGPRRTKIG